MESIANNLSIFFRNNFRFYFKALKKIFFMVLNLYIFPLYFTYVKNFFGFDFLYFISVLFTVKFPIILEFSSNFQLDDTRYLFPLFLILI